MARSNIRRLVFLGAVFALLAGWLYFWDSPASQDAARPQDEALLSFRPSQAGRIEIKTQGEQAPLVLAKQDGRWVLAGPPAIPADPDRVKGLLDVFKCGYIEIIGRRSPDAGQYGLDAPEASISLTLPGKEGPRIETVFFGDDNPGKTSCYAMIDGDPRIFLVGMLYKMELRKKAAYYRLARP